ncbi:MAG: ABC transporter ATP-binding protein [Candidatus Binataceae bacterium]
MEPVIKVENLGKRYRLGERESYQTLRESLVRWSKAPFRSVGALVRNSRVPRPEHSHVWALREVSFEVKQGEVMGLIGRNGAGKSTLLKILSRVTEPTTGRAELHGRVGSLLEVGTGFHQELSGRDNIYLSGAILGMRAAEITRKFDEIVAFAELDRFVDTPVKRYSSGMYVRLAFAVAAHLEPEILLVDEVLAVGDAVFQKKCLGKMGEVARHGRTVLFVSHNMASVESLCGSCILIKSGRVEARGKPTDIIARYLATELAPGPGWCSLLTHSGRTPSSRPLMRRVEVRSSADAPPGMVRMGAAMEIQVEYEAPSPLRPVLGVTVRTVQGVPVFCVSDRHHWQLAGCKPSAHATVVCAIEHVPLMPGNYVIDLWLGDAGVDLDVILDAISFEVLPADLTGTGQLPPPILGPVFVPATFALRSANAGRSGDGIVSTASGPDGR